MIDTQNINKCKFGIFEDSFFERNGLRILLFLMICICVFAYWEYLIFEKGYIFTGFCSDTLTQSFPEFYFRSDKMLSGELPFWSFQFELGMNIFTLMANYNPFDILLILFGKNNIPYVLPYIAMLKLITAGLFFFGFLRMLKITGYAAVIGTLMFTFSGYMVINGHWYHYHNYAVFAALMLFLFERWFQNGKWLLFVLALGLVCLKGVLQIYQFAFFFILYGIFRIIMEYGYQRKETFLFFIRFAFLYSIGVGIGAFFILPEAFYVASSSRGGGALVDFSVMDWLLKIFSTYNEWIYPKTTAFSRLFSSDLIGSWSRFKGHIYLESPASYIGLIGLIVIPSLFAVGKRREKVAFLFIVGICILYYVFPIVRTIGNAFASPTYKHTIMYVSIVLIILTSYSLKSLFLKGGRKIQTTFVIVSSIAAVFVLLVWKISFGVLKYNIIDDQVFFRIISFLLVYGVCFFLLLYLGPRQFIKFIILLIVVIELASFSRTTTTRVSGSLNPGFIKSGEVPQYFGKSTLRALEYIKSIDNGFYRIEGLSRSRNAAVVQGCYGTSGYFGFCRPGIVDFHETMRLSRQSPRLASYRDGLDMRNRLHSLLGVKYYLTSDMDIIPPEYVYLKSFGDTHIFINKYSLPLGFSYTTYINRMKFNSLPVKYKDAVLLKSFVSDNTYPDLKMIDNPRIEAIRKPIEISKKMITTHHMRILSDTMPNAIEYISTNNDPQIIIDLKHMPISDRMRIKIDLESASSSFGQIFWTGNKFSERKSTKFTIKPGRKEYVLIINEHDISSIRLDVGNKEGEHFTIHSIKLSSIRFLISKPNWGTFITDVGKLQQEKFKISNFQEDHIYGNIRLKKDAMVFFSIPYDKGWRVRVNGKRVEPEKINMGFIGILLKKGFYNIELEYVPPYFYAGIIISIISLIFICFLYYKRPFIIAFRKNGAE